MSRHDCPGDDCRYCQQRIDAAESARDHGELASDWECEAAARDMVYGVGR